MSAFVVDYVRSPFAPAHKGALAGTRPDDLIAAVIRELIRRTDVDPGAIEDLVLGCAFPEGEQGLNMARCVVLLAGLPAHVGGSTVNRWCGSSMQAVQMAAGAIAMGAGDIHIAGGVESMTRVPMMGFDPKPNPVWSESLRLDFMNMGRTAEAVAAVYDIGREAQDAYAAQSQARAAAAQADGRLSKELTPIATEVGLINVDGCIRGSTTVEKLGALKTVFMAEGGTVTAGNASPLTDGASALLVCSEAAVKANGFRPLARIAGYAVSGCAPEVMGIGPVEASRKAMARAGVVSADLDVIEMNEAFASQILACCRDLDIDSARLNRDGGAIALGHPLGATGARLVGKAANLLRRDGGKYALATQCIGGGQGVAMVLEAV